MEGLKQQSDLHAWIFIPALSPIACRVVELSPNGAILKVISLLGIPDTFEIVFEDKRQHRCKVMERWPNKVKVAFKW